MLGLSREYQTLVCWYFKSGGSDFLAYLSAFYPHLFADTSRDISSGSSLFLSALRLIASSLPLPSAPLPPPGLAPPVSSVACSSGVLCGFCLASTSGSSSSSSAFSFFLRCSSFSSSFCLRRWGGVRSMVGDSSALSGFPSAPHLSSFSVPPSALPSQSPASLSFALPSVSSWGPLGLRAPAPVVSAASAVPVVAPDPPCPLFRPFSVSEPAFAPVGSASAASGFAAAPSPSSGLPPWFAAPPGASAPPPSTFAFAPDDPFALGFADPEAPLLPPVPNSVRAEIRRSVSG